VVRPPHRPAPTASRRWRTAAILVVTAVVGAGGCGRDADIRPGDIRTYALPKDAEPAPPVAARHEEPPAAASPLAFDVPDGWTDAGASGMRLATLLIGDPADKREVTIIPASGTLEGNVERWLGQLDAQASPEERARAVAGALADAETVDVDGTAAKVVTLFAAAGNAADGEAILGAMIPRDGASALFVKFKGDAAVARRERENFIRFVTSIRWKPSP